MSWNLVMPGVFECAPPHMEFIVKMSNIPIGTRQTHRLHNFEVHQGVKSAYNAVVHFGQDENKLPFLTLLGGVGIGKTHLAIALGWKWLWLDRTVLYYQAESLLDALRDGYHEAERGGYSGYHSILGFCENASLLIIDDLGAQKGTEWATAKLDQIIDFRYINRKPLVVASNLALSRLPARIADRLREGTLVLLKGESYRKNAGGKNDRESTTRTTLKICEK